jgi:alpha-amylase/alpha-mannosidase (GH57 family)
LERYICIHGHFYQPPRENPWIEAVDLQDSAAPYHDWNRRITAECYAPNAMSRILDQQERIVRIVNNYSKISFNFGPTLLAWMKNNAPRVYEAVLEADRESMETFSGHGSALAQAYNHMIMPLADRRDKITQVLWGIRDFEHRFGRRPEGMWLPETAVDLETLDIMADQGIRFTLLAQHQAKRVRPMGGKDWENMSGGTVDPSMAYLQPLASGRAMALFFYDGSISRAVAFEKLLSSGEAFVQRLLGGFSDGRTWPQLVHIATDGESYGHHHRFGDMALAYALEAMEAKGLARLTNYGEYLEKHPPTHEVEIFENTSWSCAHGVERWRDHCGCHTGAHPSWNQGWRKPLREALDRIRDALAPAFEEKAGAFLRDPWEARDRYIDVVLDRTPETMEDFLLNQGARPLKEADRVAALKLLELQRHAMLMYTSCGWFFDDLSGIESLQIMQYAGRVLQLAGETLQEDLEPSFLKDLEQAQSNVPEYGRGHRIYERFVKPAVADLKKVAAHYAMSSLFNEYGKNTTIYCYDVEQDDYRTFEAGKARLVLGRAVLTSRITRETIHLSFGVLHLGDHNINCGVRTYRGGEHYDTMIKEISRAFERADFAETIRGMDRHFGISTYSLQTLFRDEQRKILNLILESTMNEAEAAYRRLYLDHSPLIRFLRESNSPLPRALETAAVLVLNADLHRAVGQKPLDPDRIRALLEEAEETGLPLEQDTLEYQFRKNLEEMADAFSLDPVNLSLLSALDDASGILRDVPFQTNLWTIQNVCHGILQTTYSDQKRKADQGDEEAGAWIERFNRLAEILSVKIPEP